MTRRRRPGEPLRLVVLCPHLDPDTAPTGRVMSRIVAELVGRGHRVDVITALPWYRAHAIEAGWGGRLVRTEQTAWGSITRVHPFPGADKRRLWRRALGFAGFSALAWVVGSSVVLRRRPHAVVSMSPPLTLGLTAELFPRRCPHVFNIQDVFPDAAIETGAITNRAVIAGARWLERLSYRCADAVTVLSDDLRDNVAGKLGASRRDKVVVIPNFVDTEQLAPADRITEYRRQLGIGDEPVVLYAGNVGFSQSLELVVAAAQAIPEATFVINGDGAARATIEEQAAGLANMRVVGYQPPERLAEVLASGDVHVVPLRRGLGRVSVPSKTYSILAAGRCIVAAIDPGTEVPRILDASGAGIAVEPDDAAAFVAAVRTLVADPQRRRAMGEQGRRWVESAASPAAVAAQYEQLIERLAGR
jgi:colanic acid biosynthesis glycosyl transferase WcaI